MSQLTNQFSKINGHEEVSITLSVAGIVICPAWLCIFTN